MKPFSVYSVFVTDRGGQRRIGMFPRPSRLTWGRVRDDISQATLTVIDLADDRPTRELVRTMRAVRHELQIVRDAQVVWEGPITLIEASEDSVTITARDVLWYASRYRLESTLDNTYPNINTCNDVIEAALLQWCGGADPYNFNVQNWLTPISGPDDPQTSQVFPAKATTVWEVMDKLAEDGGVDYTVLGRRILWWDVHLRAATMRPLSDADFVGQLVTVEYGSELVTRATLTNSEGVTREYTADQEWIDYYGIVDQVEASQDSDNDGEADTVVIGTAKRRVEQGIPAPTRIRVPENVPITGQSDITFTELVPGTWAQITASRTVRPMSSWHKLHEVKVSVEAGVESINVTFIPGTAVIVDPE